MKDNHTKMVQDVIKTINWERIRHFHCVFDIKWEFEEKGGGITERYPSVQELKEELKTLLTFAITKNAKTLDYGNWLIFWNNEDELSGSKLNAIFSLEDCFVIDRSNIDHGNLSILEEKLETAIQKEKYEDAARLRDLINEKKRKYNIE